MSSPLTLHHASSNPSPQLVTPSGTPPNHQGAIPHFETRLQQLLANCHTHTFDGEERETPAERRASFGHGGGVPIPAGRRPSFLSSLSLTRPFTSTSNPSSGQSTPIQTPTTASHIPSGLTMTSSTSNTSTDTPAHAPPPLARPKSTTGVPTHHDHSPEAPAPSIQRSHTSPTGPVKVAGFSLGQMVHGKMKIQQEEQRHFDPSKEPRLLSLL